MIPVSEPLLPESAADRIAACVRSGWISSSGPEIEEFERKWSAYCGAEHGVAVCNGSAALQLAIAALKLSDGDEIILPTFTIISCATAILLGGGTPVLVDADAGTWTMDVEQVAAKITPRTKAIMVVHIYGHPVDMDPIIALADQHGLAIIEDAAEAHGAEYLTRRGTDTARWQRAGGFGLISCFSFYANKLITTGEGGMLLTSDDELADRLRSLRNLCFDSNRRFAHFDIGFNFRMTNMQAALGLAQLEGIDDLVSKKRSIAGEYSSRFASLSMLQLPVEESWARSMYWMYGVVISDELGVSAEQFARELLDRGIESRPFFLGMHEQPIFRKQGLFAGERYPVAERLARQGLYLPSGLTLTDAQLKRVVTAVEEVADR